MRATPGVPERRRHPRAEWPCAVAYCLGEGDGAGEWRPAQLVDVSEGGVGILCDRPPTPGAALTLRFGADPDGAATPARVAHVQERPGGHWLVGCHFALERDAR